ncbi:cation diffusion facilitator family transporter [Arsenicibacter rosenii]|uniref:Cation diffusion facilitator family transporter n=1 Tax=Arsenicibacter rosenii TaxID=1750698 RepID=A0A1S2VEY2_9BACT|nr:cation diffusion facilitator family transporter [Arsenicibacter rosenii]OIN57317.1 cation diffusion facilitator family transporter [Arsenicibacter rosenii]
MSTLQQTKFRWMTVSLALSVTLLLLKMTAWYLTNSAAILTDALESIVNVLASGFALYSIYLAGQPRDFNHPYGHGKVEFLSSGFEGALIVSAGFFTFYTAIMSFFSPHDLKNLDWGLLLVAISTIANAATGWMLIRTGRQTDSMALIADGRHLLTDSLSSVIVLAGIGLVWLTGQAWLDSVLSLVLSIVICFNGYHLVRHATARLLDETDTPTLDRVVTLLRDNRNTTWIDVHNLRVQKYGADLHIDCHLTLPRYWELTGVHQTVNHFENTLKSGFTSEVEIFVHADPCLPDCCHYCRVADCPVRAFPFLHDMIWSADNLPLNQKHFVSLELPHRNQ